MMKYMKKITKIPNINSFQNFPEKAKIKEIKLRIQIFLNFTNTDTSIRQDMLNSDRFNRLRNIIFHLRR